MQQRVAVIHETPPQLYAPDTLAILEGLLREALAADVGVARAYLHALVARVVVAKDGSVDVLALSREAATSTSLRRATLVPRPRR